MAAMLGAMAVRGLPPERPRVAWVAAVGSPSAAKSDRAEPMGDAVPPSEVAVVVAVVVVVVVAVAVAVVVAVELAGAAGGLEVAGAAAEPAGNVIGVACIAVVTGAG